MKTKKWILSILVVGIVTAIFVYNYIYQDHRDIKSEKATFTLTAQEMANAFASDEQAATEKYLNKTIEVEGVVEIAQEKTIMMSPGVFFALSESNNNHTSVGATAQIKGRCIGYDSLLEEIKFDQSTFTN